MTKKKVFFFEKKNQKTFHSKWIEQQHTLQMTPNAVQTK